MHFDFGVNLPLSVFVSYWSIHLRNIAKFLIRLKIKLIVNFCFISYTHKIYSFYLYIINFHLWNQKPDRINQGGKVVSCGVSVSSHLDIVDLASEPGRDLAYFRPGTFSASSHHGRHEGHKWVLSVAVSAQWNPILVLKVGWLPSHSTHSGATLGTWEGSYLLVSRKEISEEFKIHWTKWTRKYNTQTMSNTVNHAEREREIYNTKFIYKKSRKVSNQFSKPSSQEPGKQWNKSKPSKKEGNRSKSRNI